MKLIQIGVDLVITSYPDMDPKQPRIPVFLNGINDFANFWGSYPRIPIISRDGVENLPLTGNVNMEIDAPVFPYVSPIANYGSGRMTVASYTFPGNFVSVSATPLSSSNRSLYQLMQQIAEHKPFLNKIRIQISHKSPTISSDTMAQLGTVYIGGMGDPLLCTNPYYDSISMLDHFKPDNFNAGFENPQNFLSGKPQKFIEIDIPIGKQIDGNTMLAVTAPIMNYNRVRQIVTLFLD